MVRTVGIGKQNYEKIVRNNNFYIDKTNFIKEWWENDDEVTLIARPRRFGKTLNMSMTEQFFSVDYAGRSDLFENMNIWQDEKYREMHYFEKASNDMTEMDAIVSLQRLCGYMKRYYKKDVIILLDEYDTPMQEAYLNGYWDEIVNFIGNLFNCTFKTNPYLDRVKDWYDGFTFGNITDIYNPWSIINFLDEKNWKHIGQIPAAMVL